MTFKALQDELINTRFKETQRANVKSWLNLRYAQLWGAEDWTFRKATATVTCTAGSSSLTGLPAVVVAGDQVGPVIGLQRADGSSLRYLEPRDFYMLYQGQTTQGYPTDFTVVNGSVIVGPVPSATDAAMLLLYDKNLTQLVNDNDTPAFPSEYHYVLVHGAMVTGLVQENDFTWQFQAQMWQEGLEAMRSNCLTVDRGEPRSYGRDPLGVDL